LWQELGGSWALRKLGIEGLPEFEPLALPPTCSYSTFL
jgi:hypothetical protein